MAQIIQFRRDYSSNWTLANPVLAEGELGVEFDNYNVKIGNGISSWNQLPYGLGTVSAVGGNWNTSTITGTNILISTGATNTLYYPGYITTAALSNHTHDYASSDHTHSQYLTTAMASNAGSLYQLTSDNSLSLGTGYTTHTHLYQSTGNYLTTAMQSNMTSAFQYTSNTSNITSNAFPTASTTQLAVSSVASRIIQINGSSGSLSLAIGSSLSSSSNASTITFGLASNITTALQSAGAYLTTAMASGNTSLYMSTSERDNYFYTSNNTFANNTHIHGGLTINATNISTSITSASNGLTINLSAAAPSAGGGIAASIGGNSTSAGAGYSNITSGTMILAGGNNITLSQNGSIVTIIGGAGGAGAALQGSGTYTQNSGTIQFANSNGITFGLTNNQMTASVANNAGSLGFADSNGITFGVASTTSNSSTVVTASVKTDYAGTGTTITTTTGTNLAMTLNTAGLNIAHPAWLTTATAAGGAAPNRSICEIIPGEYLTRVINISATQVSNKILFNPFWLDGQGLVASTVRFMMSWVTNTTPPVFTYGAALYKMANSTQATLYDSTTATVNYATSQSASYSGIRVWDVTGMTKSLDEGRYILGLYFSYGATSNANASLYGASNWPAIAGYISGNSGTATTNNTLHLFPFQGRYSTTTAAFPDTVNINDIYGGRSQDAFDYYAILKQV